jgi:hypothetical protein
MTSSTKFIKFEPHQIPTKLAKSNQQLIYILAHKMIVKMMSQKQSIFLWLFLMLKFWILKSRMLLKKLKQF